MPMLEKWTPFRELDRMERRVRRVFEDAGFFPMLTPAADIYEAETEYVVELEVPGFEEKELAIEVSDHTLLVKGERKAETEKREKALLLRERLERQFARRFELPPESDSEHVTAEYGKGVLTLHVPKIAISATRKIEIKAA